MKHPNPPRTTANVWWGITALAVFGIFAPHIFGMDGFDGGFAISTFCLLLAVTGIIVAIIYMKRAGVLDKILGGNDLLAHWTYAQDEWLQYAKEEHKREQSAKKGLFILIAAISLLIGIIFVIMDPENGQWVLYAMLALTALIAFVAWFTAWYNYRQNLKYHGEAYITPDAVYLNRQLHTWNSLGAQLDSVSLEKEEAQPYLEFKYTAPTRTGIQEYSVRVPVPRGKEAEARDVLGKMTSPEIETGNI